MWVTPDSGSTWCGRPAASSADDSCSVWAATTLSSASPWTSSSGPLEPVGVGEQRRAVVGLGSSVGVAQVALGVVRVVQAPLGDRRAGDGGVEHVGPAQHGQRGQVAAEAPAPDRHPVQVELRDAASAAALQRLDLVLEHRRRPGRGGPPAPTSLPRPGVPRPSATTTAKPWSANHCEARKASAAADAPAGRGARRRGRAARAAGRRGQRRGGAGPRSAMPRARRPAAASRSGWTSGRLGEGRRARARRATPVTRRALDRASPSGSRPCRRRPTAPWTPGSTSALGPSPGASSARRARSVGSSIGLASEHDPVAAGVDDARGPGARAA